jgi:hypothetical protein
LWTLGSKLRVVETSTGQPARMVPSSALMAVTMCPVMPEALPMAPAT